MVSSAVWPIQKEGQDQDCIQNKVQPSSVWSIETPSRVFYDHTALLPCFNGFMVILHGLIKNL